MMTRLLDVPTTYTVSVVALATYRSNPSSVTSTPNAPSSGRRDIVSTTVMIEQWRRHYNEVRPHSSLGYRPPAPQVIVSGKKTKEFEDGFLSTH